MWGLDFQDGGWYPKEEPKDVSRSSGGGAAERHLQMGWAENSFPCTPVVPDFAITADSLLSLLKCWARAGLCGRRPKFHSQKESGEA